MIGQVIHKSRPRLFACGLLLLFTALAGCASRPEAGFLAPVSQPAPTATEHSLLIATTRERDARPGTLFNGERTGKLDFAFATLSVPPSHVAGAIEWPSSPPGNPDTQFVVRKAGYLDGDKEFVRALNQQLALRPKGKRNVLMFIHGYNTMFAEGVYRFTQIVHDANAPGVPVLFTWASHGQLTDYVYDLNSATEARDDLEHTFRLIASSDADQINIVAHSMGNWVTVEAARQIKMTGGTGVGLKFGTVILAAPDIDIDVFESQMRRIGRPKKPFFVVLSKYDTALRFSKLIAGEKGRLGSDADVQKLAALGAIVIDLSKSNDASDHSQFAQLATAAPELASVLKKGISAEQGASPGAQAVGGTLASFITLPTRVLAVPFN